MAASTQLAGTGQVPDVQICLKLVLNVTQVASTACLVDIQS